MMEFPRFDLTGQVSLVTGAARGLGRAYALRLADLGADVAVVDIDLDAAREFGEALKAEKGPVTVNGYTDNQPIHTVQFPSNFQLSAMRADAARSIIVGALGDPGRVSAQGHADANPVASNGTPDGRDQNRRIEVVLRRQG